jgi:hypothetical protein
MNPADSKTSSRFADAWLFPIVLAALAVAIWMMVDAHRVRAGQAPLEVSRAKPTHSTPSGFVEARRFPAGVPEPRGLAVGKDGVLSVAGDGKIRQCRLDGTPLRIISITGAARCVTVDRDGILYVGISNHVAVCRGEMIAEWKPFDPQSVVTSISVRGNDVWVADAGKRMVWRCNRDGKIIGRFAEKNEARNAPGLVIPSPYFDVAMGSDGLLRVADTGRHRIELYAMDGTLVSSWGQPSMAEEGFCGCCNPTDIAILPDGRVVTSEKKIPRVKIYQGDGRFIGTIAGAETFDPQTAGIDLAADAKGRIYALDPVRGEVRVYEEKGKP